MAETRAVLAGIGPATLEVAALLTRTISYVIPRRKFQFLFPAASTCVQNFYGRRRSSGCLSAEPHTQEVGQGFPPFSRNKNKTRKASVAHF